MRLNFIILLGFLVVFGSNAYGQSYGVEPGFESPRVVAGEVNSEGVILKGTGFTVTHPSAGHFVIHFQPGVFPKGCPVVTATPAFKFANPPLAAVYQSDKLACTNSFRVLLSWAGTDVFTDRPFTFIAAGT
jgi:hypothetical protein